MSAVDGGEAMYIGIWDPNTFSEISLLKDMKSSGCVERYMFDQLSMLNRTSFGVLASIAEPQLFIWSTTITYVGVLVAMVIWYPPHLIVTDFGRSSECNPIVVD